MVSDPRTSALPQVIRWGRVSVAWGADGGQVEGRSALLHVIWADVCSVSLTGPCARSVGGNWLSREEGSARLSRSRQAFGLTDRKAELPVLF